jgi:hypothetical protein
MSQVVTNFRNLPKMRCDATHGVEDSAHEKSAETMLRQDNG